MVIWYELVHNIILNLIVPIMLVVIFGYKWWTRKDEYGKRDHIKFFVFIGFVDFMMGGIIDFIDFMTGVQYDPNNLIPAGGIMIFLTMLLDLTQRQYIFFIPFLAYIHVCIFFPEWGFYYMVGFGMITLILLFVLGFKYKENTVLSMGVISAMGLLLLFMNGTFEIILDLINAIFKILFAFGKIKYFKDE